MPRKAIVHIGPMKTGSSSIQSYLYRRRAALRDAGFLVPEAIGAPNMSRLSYMSQVLAANEEITEKDAQRLDALRAEIAALPDSVDTVIFSGEMLGHQLKRQRDLRAFKTMLDEFFDDYRIVLYLRRQDELSLSRYSTALRHGFKRAAPLMPAINYENILNAWGKTFGRDAMHPRIFDRNIMPDGDVVRDFAEANGLPMLGVDKDPIERNVSILPEAQAFLAHLADAIRAAGFTENLIDLPCQDTIIRALGANYKGRGTKPSRDAAIAFYDSVRESNERVRQEWFPDRPTLFDEDFSSYSEEATPAPSAEQLLEVATAVLVAMATVSVSGGPGGDSAGPVTPRRDAKEKNEMRARRNRHRRIRQRRRKRGVDADKL